MTSVPTNRPSVWGERPVTSRVVHGEAHEDLRLSVPAGVRGGARGRGSSSRTAGSEVLQQRRPPTPSQRDTWIIVCEHFHGAVGPIPTERLAVDLAAHASEIGACIYRPVRLALAQGRAADRIEPENDIRSTA